MLRYISNPLLKKYEFETSDSKLANKFLRILYLFHVRPEDIYVSPDFFDVSQIEFRTTKKKMVQMRYVLRRYADDWKVGDKYEIY